MSIITISREFGSGGRELGKRLADALGYAYYDNEIVTAVAKKFELDENYVERTLDGGIMNGFSFNFSRTLTYSPYVINQDTMKLFIDQHNILKEVAAKGNCVIVGRAADALLHEYNPFNIFVYADMESKVRRCMERANAEEYLTEKELIKKIKKIDSQRKKYYSIFSNTEWGEKEGYHLMINTTNVNIKELVEPIINYYRVFHKTK